jgi:DNA primase
VKDFAKGILIRSSLFSDVILACKYLLKTSKNAEKHREYIYNRIPKNYIKKFNVGYFPSDLNELLKLVPKKSLEHLDLIYNWTAIDHSHVIYNTINKLDKHNIIFPFKDEYGNIISLAGRTILSKQEQEDIDIPKYKNTPFNKSVHLFGLYEAKEAIKKKGSVIVVEGQIDCITCHSHGIHNVVALGCSALSRYQLYLLKKYSNDIYLLLDNDPSGKKAERKIINRFSKYANIKKINLPECFSDIDECLSQNGTIDLFNL